MNGITQPPSPPPACRERSIVSGLAIWLLLIPAALLNGCAASGPPIGHWFGPASPATATVQEEEHPNGNNWLVQTDHYDIYTTISDQTLVKKIAVLMEGSLTAYHTLAPGVPLTDHRMECYLFATHAQWEEFTRERTGSQAGIYLQINRGGYTVGDWFVSYYLGDSSTLSVSAHEGWHQFVARHFRGRLPPFLEEGLATMFESVAFKDGVPRFNLSVNLNRAIALREAIESKSLFPLDQAVGMHAGMVVGKTGNKIEAFYAEAWGFARFLWDADNGKYRPVLQRILADTAAGTVYDPTGSLQFRTRPFDPNSPKLMLEHYLGEDFTQISADYNRFIQHVAYEELPRESDQPG